MRHLNSLLELKPANVNAIFGLARTLKDRLRKGDRPQVLSGYVMAQVFEKPSLRTRLSFDAAMMQLGGASIFLNAKEAGLGGREAVPDVARVIGGYSDVITLRTFSQKLIDAFIEHSGVAVINGLSDERHPCQALTDLFTMQEVIGEVKGKKCVFVGDGNNVANSLAIAASLCGMSFVVCSPEGYRLEERFLKALAKKCPSAEVSQTDNFKSAMKDAAIVYTDVWTSMGQEAEAEERQKVFGRYQVNEKLMKLAPKTCRFMHCLPAKRGLEVTDEVIDGPQSIVFQQAQNRMHLAKGLLLWVLEKSI
ncbi:MAG: ornithine carbamoyltransferase [Planctomycetota bacterium]|jgi:ornithine carbamoyltransferase|nr:MAG: ornithine carbamoyltransferase [Planctomycetota bacterium]